MFDVKRGIDATARGNGFGIDQDTPLNPLSAPYQYSMLQVSSLFNVPRMIRQLTDSVNGCGNDMQAIPIEILVVGDFEDRELEGTFLFPFLVSLGTLPALRHTTNKCHFEIAVGSGIQRKTYKLNRIFATDAKLTAFSPIGLIDYGEEPGTISHRRGMGEPSSLEYQQKCSFVFVDTMAEALHEALVRYEAGK